ncbi:gamma-glutamyl-gamma-aminobutyrate hydrolase family protein [Herbiconiux sp. KACC 21604]|uniref:gamma-glutamyl-gamma-aminobutyrate hydrolase family protein n=1 Tax=unclassified Herbiconiux TaxID=2618217 RepID=UPI0020A4D86D|nr:gamma-glutamyl-gamma-aminobutyrate hydrolase family protein [Herbiconiux sp. SALV-R1]WPO84795.1 gamma-glutamyl-gamma-aminobutyrate hydrolase family protein [Herbiconiux sp. KACC 21604]
MSSAPLLSIVSVTEARPHAPEYHAYSAMLAERTAHEAREAGWRVERVAAADVSVGTSLRRTERAAALVLLGGEDIAPEFYGAARGYRAEGAHAERADEAQILMVGRALDRGTPLLGICRGHQIIDVALGGTLVQDLGEHSGHRNDGVEIHRVMSDHDVELLRGTRLHRALGDRVVTRSAHHQAIDRLGAGLRVAARASDGLVEAVEHETAPITGVQWHPEDPRAPRGQLGALLAGLATPALRLAA